MSKRVYSLDPKDWKIDCTECGEEKVYTHREGYKNAMRALKKKGYIKCSKCRNLGGKRTEEVKLKMSIAAKERDRTCESWLERNKKISLGHLKRYEVMTEEEREELNNKIRAGQESKSWEEIYEWRSKMSKARKAEMVRNGVSDIFKPSYNKDTISIIENELSREYDTAFIHAESEDGEFRLYDREEKRFYYADAYSKEKNIWIEFDEKHHLSQKWKDRDKFRQKRVVELLDCQFIRIPIDK